MAREKNTSVQVRIIATLYMDGKQYAPNQVVEFDGLSADALDGAIDADPAAVAYCVEVLGVQPVKHSA